MTPTEAATIIGCSPQQVRTLIRNGKLKARRKSVGSQFVYSISKQEAERYRDQPQSRGWRRGKKRKD